MSDPKHRTALLFLAIAQLSTFVLVIVLLSRVPPAEYVNEQHETLKKEIVENLINSPEFQDNLDIANHNARQLNNMRSIIQDVVRVEIAKAYRSPSSILESKIKNGNAQFAAKK